MRQKRPLRDSSIKKKKEKELTMTRHHKLFKAKYLLP